MNWKADGGMRPAAGLFLAVVLAASGAAATGGEGARPAPPAQGSCGGPGRPPCPLQAWMRANVAAPLASNDLKALAAGLEKAARLSPDPSWSSWPTLARSGAEAARKGDIAGARAACKGCHDAWRETYRAKFRPRPVPR